MGSILLIFLWKEDSLNSIIYQHTKYGQITCNLKEVMQKEKISTYRLANMANIKYGIVKRYRDNNVYRFDASILARLCFCLDCELSSLLKYEK